MKYQELKEGIERRLNAAAEDFFTIGYYLRQISEGALFLEDGYKNIWDFAKGEYGLSTASASRYMAINMKFSGDGGQTMQAKYIGMGSSKLQEMLTLPDEDLDRVTKETTVREIRAMKAEKKKPLSYFGWPAKAYPEGSLLTTKGCAPEDGRGGHDCFLCYRDCAIRQEETQCYTAPLGSPHPCSFTKEDREVAERVSAGGALAKRCLHLHPEKAPTCAGDGEPTVCCLLCDAFKDRTCNFLCCDVAKERRAKERQEEERRAEDAAREAQQEGQKQLKAEKTAGRDIYTAEWEVLYKWLGADAMEEITAAALWDACRPKIHKLFSKGRQDHTGASIPDLGGPGHSGWADCSPRGIQIAAGGSKTKRATWGAAAAALNSIRETMAPEAKNAAEVPTVIDAEESDFIEIDDATQDAARGPAVPACEALEAMDRETPTEEPEAPTEAQGAPQDAKPWRTYSAQDVREILTHEEFDLKQYEEVQAECMQKGQRQLPLKMIQKRQIIVDALGALYEKMAAFDRLTQAMEG